MEQPCIFEALLAPADGHVIPTPDQVKDESYAILNAASDTTGNAMNVSAYHAVTNSEIHGNLTAGLRAAFPTLDEKLEFSKLEKLPYLVTATSYFLSSIFNVAPDRSYERRIKVCRGSYFGSWLSSEDFLSELLGVCRGLFPNLVNFSGYHLPAGVSFLSRRLIQSLMKKSFVSMSVWDMHHNEIYFPDAEKFDSIQPAGLMARHRDEWKRHLYPSLKAVGPVLELNMSHTFFFTIF
jgi:hypothetical protein